jgi:hypothetical protein
MASIQTKDVDSTHEIPSFLFSLGVCIALFGILSSVTWFWLPEKTFRIIPSGSYAVAAAILLSLAAVLYARFDFRRISVEPNAFSWGIVLVFLSDWMCGRYNFFQAPTIRGELILGCIIMLILVRRHALWIFRILPLFVIALLAINFFNETQGRVLFSDDHSTFFFRLTLLKENFPSIPFYYPFWNGGIDARDFFATGSLNLFFLSSPFLYLFPVEKIYNILIAFILFALVPGATYLAARLEKVPSQAASIAVLLSLSCGYLWYKWGLAYGTIGFIISTSLIPLNLVLVSKILSRDQELNNIEALLFIISCTFMLFWSLSGVVFFPLILLGLFSIVRLLKKRYILLIILALFIINLPWILLFWSASNVSNFLVSEKSTSHTAKAHLEVTLKNKDINTPAAANKTNVPLRKGQFKHHSGGIELNKALHLLREAAISTNPLLIFLGIPGLFLLKRRSKIPFFATSIWLLILGSLLVNLKPQLELDRMLVILSFCLCIPAGLAIHKIFSKVSLAKPGIITYTGPLLVGAYLLTGPLLSAAIIRNRGLAPYRTLNDSTAKIIKIIKNYKGDGRMLFSGCIVHELNGGHLGPLAYYTKKPLIASSYVHNLWNYRRVVPREFLKHEKEGKEGIKEYFDLYNVTAVFAYEPYLKSYFSSLPLEYKLIWESDFRWPIGPLRLYKRINYDETYFLKGSGKIISQESNRIVLSVDSPEAVIKFNYFPFLKSSQCKIEAESIAEAEKQMDRVVFIKLTDCPLNEEIEIKSVSPFKRLLL